MDLVTLLQVLWLRDKVKETPVSTAKDKPELEYYEVGDYCPADGKFYRDGQVCINNRVTIKLPKL